jgi:hypothetical protein
MDLENYLLRILITGVLILSIGKVHAGSAKEVPDSLLDYFRLVNDYVDENEECFRCHGETKFLLPSKETGRILTRHMCRDHLILREDFYRSNHKSFACLDCHSYEYKDFPHPLEPRLEEPFTCLDCHGGDEAYAHYHFEEIEKEFKQSVHYLANPGGFTCWKCHPHSYHISIRNTENLEATIAYDNSICLSCHADFDEFELLTDREGINIIQTHDWLPNQALHFRNVRCIECHTRISDSILVAHLVQPKEKAVRLCSECHSSNSLLMATLYKFQAKEARNEFGFFNAVVMNNAYVIGANRNYFLNVISLLIFGLTFVGIAVHLVFRIRNKV